MIVNNRTRVILSRYRDIKRRSDIIYARVWAACVIYNIRIKLKCAK